MILLTHSLIWLVHCLLILLTVAFFTLFERKYMSAIHLRVGPVKPTFLGLLQPLLDAFKLLSKQHLYPLKSNKLTYHIAPHLSLAISLSLWLLIPLYSLSFTHTYSALFLLLLSSLSILSALLSGWASNSKYSLIGALRTVSSSVSYEAIFTTLILALLFFFQTYSIRTISRSHCTFGLILLPLWLLCTLAELHRTPFDFIEAESELVSGYNTEYRGSYFAYLFLSEYSALLFHAILTYYIFLGLHPAIHHPLVVGVGTVAITSLFTSLRCSLPRLRYDHLILLSWKILLPIALTLLILTFFGILASTEPISSLSLL